ncbi:MAG: PLP-dependent transferase [Bacteroidales bacterium]|jgi:cystathionine beta-lyase/cystathionine gamma-synthase|nr:PLP-dependent transferase [Bacteroidales bacterium]
MSRKVIKSTRVPVYRDSGFRLDNASEMADAFGREAANLRDPDNYIYSRYRNPTVVAAEEEIMKLEGSRWSLLAQSGMAAVDTAVSLFHKGSETRPWMFFADIYGGTLSYITSILNSRRGVKTEKFESTDNEYDLDRLGHLLKKIRPEFLYFEVISNPMLIVADGEAVINLCRSMGVKTIVDNTFATPLLWKPLDYGADLVIHSATKYFSGHGNLTAGVICGNDEKLMSEAVSYRKLVGHMISPDDAYRLNTQILSFSLRFRQQCSNAMLLAEMLERSPLTEHVWYPGLRNHKTNPTARRLFEGRGFGAMVTFSFSGSSIEEKRTRRDKFISSVIDRIHLVPTLGDPHTILMPVEPVWGDRYPDPGMIRLSVGFEPFEELSATISEALDTIS